MTPQELSQLTDTYNALVYRMQSAEQLLHNSAATMKAAQSALNTSPPFMREAAASILSDAIANHQAVESELREATTELVTLRLQYPFLPQS